MDKSGQDKSRHNWACLTRHTFDWTRPAVDVQSEKAKRRIRICLRAADTRRMYRGDGRLFLPREFSVRIWTRLIRIQCNNCSIPEQSGPTEHVCGARNCGRSQRHSELWLGNAVNENIISSEEWLEIHHMMCLGKGAPVLYWFNCGVGHGVGEEFPERH